MASERPSQLSPLEARIAALRNRCADSRLTAFFAYISSALCTGGTVTFGGWSIQEILADPTAQSPPGILGGTAIFAGCAVLAFGTGLHFDREAANADAEISRLESEQALGQAALPILPGYEPQDPHQNW